MNVSLGIYSISLIFIYIIIPGYIARRFYFHGEFSKQINISSSPFVHIVYSSFVGLAITFSFVSLLNCSESVSINFEKLLKNFQNNFLQSSSENAISFTNGVIIGENPLIYEIYLPFIVFLYFISSVIGYYLSKIVIFYKLDTRYKFLRFNNDWHYVFNGKIFQFKKHSIPDTNTNLEVKYTYLDVLVENINDEPILYSGFLADYDLSSKDNGKIERLHLLKASKYAKDENGETNQKNISGNLFTILGEKILNINCVYICFDSNEILSKKLNKSAKIFKYKSNILFTFQILSLLSFIAISVIIIFKLNFFKCTWVENQLSKPLIYRFLVVFILNVSFGLITPFKIDRVNKKINPLPFFEIFLKILLIALLIALIVFNFN